jgi:hypothetical protein
MAETATQSWTDYTTPEAEYWQVKSGTLAITAAANPDDNDGIIIAADDQDASSTIRIAGGKALKFRSISTRPATFVREPIA